ncbi:hypothetical protein GCM10007301_47510 [Azorhizobium oxalatiphilum]|uniref:Secreted protein n=1 Tax=Azorhizobium oxalatiphilum TaxID=980631 RepID=A0A917CAD8_9HYPH|nr:hypothetical protein [Azorhizobium oxalatiphilum]GGF81882.1 hypothetical protein GCM10007301_47510 [Azorhizobium oxalatiphilum]
MRIFATKPTLTATAPLALIGLWLVAAIPMGVTVSQAAEQGTSAACDTSKDDAPGNHAATPQQTGSNSGTAPGNTGNTGWTNGNGGTFAGTSPHAETPGSPTRQPETVTNANPGSAEQPRKPC